MDDYVFAALKAGASGFIVKDTPREGIVAAVRTISDGDGLLSPGVTGHFISRRDNRRPSGAAPGP